MPSVDDQKQQHPPRRKGGLEGELESRSMEELLRIYDEKMAEFSEGDIVRGRVLQVNPTDIVIDIGYKSEGVLPASEVASPEGEVSIKPGEEIDVYIDKLGGPGGHVQLSREKAERVRVWDRIEEAFNHGTAIPGRIIDRVKGGLSVDVGVKAFLPGSLVDLKPVKNLDALKGKEFEFKVVSFDKKRNNIVLSRRAILEAEQDVRKRQTFATLEEGKITHGLVKNITDYGVFVDLGGIDGLLHITDISWGRVTHPSEFFNIGDEIEVVILKFDATTEKVSLGYKQKTPDPWLDVAERYPLGSKVQGKVVSLTDYGAFVELEEGVEGLVHISEMSWTRRVRPSKILSVGEAIEAVVSDVNVPNRRISLSLRALEQNPWETIGERYPVGSTMTGKVRNITDFGAFVEVEEGIDGLIHISDMSWNRRLKHPGEVLKKGDTVTARVINVDGENQRLSLSIKEFLPNEWDEFAKKHEVGNELIGTVSKITDFGLFIRLAEGVEGLAHVSEIEKDPKTRLDRLFKTGDVVQTRIIKLDWTDRKIGLSLRGVEPVTEEEKGSLAAAPQEALPSAAPQSEAPASPPAAAETAERSEQTPEPGNEPQPELTGDRES